MDAYWCMTCLWIVGLSQVRASPPTTAQSPDGTEQSQSNNTGRFRVALSDIWSRIYAVHQSEKAGKGLLDESYRKLNVDLDALHACQLHPLMFNFDTNVTLHEEVTNLVNNHDITLITFTVEFPEYAHNPMRVNTSKNYYKPNVLFRTYDHQAYTLLSLPFNYKVLSLYTLWFGTVEMLVKVVDYPQGCMARLAEEHRVAVLMNLVSRDMKQDPQELTSPALREDALVCHQVIQQEGPWGDFSYRCCRLGEDGELECTTYNKPKWLSGFFILFLLVDIIAFFFGPLLLHEFLFKETIWQKPYEVGLDPPYEGTVGDQKSANTIRVTKLILAVDHRNLITRDNPPIGVFKYLYEHVFLGKMSRSEPFYTCCKTPLLRCFSVRWGQLGLLFGKFLSLCIFSLPLYIRLVTYYMFENQEVQSRKAALSRLNLTQKVTHDWFHYLTPSHTSYSFFVIYGVIMLSSCILLMMRWLDNKHFETIVIAAFNDMRNVKVFEAFRLLFTHILWPFATFGLLGLFIAPFYWAVAVTFCLVLVIFYSVPTLYLVARLLCPDRAWLLERCHHCCIHMSHSTYWRSPIITQLLKPIDEDNVIEITEEIKKERDCKENNDLTSGFSEKIYQFRKDPQHVNITSPLGSVRYEKSMEDEKKLFLHRISPKEVYSISTENTDDWKRATNHPEAQVAVIKDLTPRQKSLQSISHFAFEVTVRINCVILLLCSMLFFSEIVGFFAQVAIYTFMGTIVKVDSFGQFLIITLSLLLYCMAKCKRLYKEYADLNEKVFDLFSSRLDDAISELTSLTSDKQRNTAFKYLEKETLEDSGPSSFFSKEGGELRWHCKALVCFVDVTDTPRMPRLLFDLICQLEVPGSPGKLVLRVLDVIKDILFMVLFLAFVLFVVMMFRAVHVLTTTQQMLFTLAGSLLPFLTIVSRISSATQGSGSHFNSYAFSGAINDILIRKYLEGWPVCGFVVTNPSSSPNDTNANETIKSKASFSATDEIVSTREVGTQTGQLPEHVTEVAIHVTKKTKLPNKALYSSDRTMTLNIPVAASATGQTFHCRSAVEHMSMILHNDTSC